MKPIIYIILGGLVITSCSKKKVESKPLQVVAANAKWDTHADYGGTPTQSFTITNTGKLDKVDLAISGRENPRELLVLIRQADSDGYPKGNVLTSGIAIIVPSESKEVEWHSISMNEQSKVLEPGEYSITCIPSKPVNKFGYFEYGYTKNNNYSAGRFHRRSYSRSIPKDDGADLSFRVYLRKE